MISMRRLVKCIRYVRCVHNDQSSPQLPKYRTRADQLNNPYRDQFTYGRKPRTFRERYIESKKNEAKPKITSSHLNLKQSRPRKHSFYETEQVDRFSELGIADKLTQQIAELGVIHPTTVQTDVIPVLLQNENCVFIGPTGAGKTYTYLLPAVQNVLESRSRGFVSRTKAPRIIIMTPTKFLASQISVVAEHLTQDLQLRTECLSSLTPSRQRQVVSSVPPVDIMVGTYDNIMSHITSGVVSTADLQHLIIDEVESWLDYRNVDENLPFLKEFVDIEEGGTKCQIAMCGAILPTEGFAKLRDVIPGLLRYLNPYCHVPLGHVTQSFHFVNNKQKPQHFVNVLRNYIEQHNMKFNRPLIFCNYSNAAFWLHKYLITEGINNIMLGKSDKRGQKDVLMRTELPSTDYPIVAVDAASFGLDFRDVGLVVNYEFPFTYEDYIRRCGRTGRMSSYSNKCEVISYVSHNRDKALFNIVKNSTTSSECKAYSLLSPNKFGWIK